MPSTASATARGPLPLLCVALVGLGALPLAIRVAAERAETASESSPMVNGDGRHARLCDVVDAASGEHPPHCAPGTRIALAGPIRSTTKRAPGYVPRHGIHRAVGEAMRARTRACGFTLTGMMVGMALAIVASLARLFSRRPECLRSCRGQHPDGRAWTSRAGCHCAIGASGWQDLHTGFTGIRASSIGNVRRRARATNLRSLSSRPQGHWWCMAPAASCPRFRISSRPPARRARLTRHQLEKGLFCAGPRVVLPPMTPDGRWTCLTPVSKSPNCRWPIQSTSRSPRARRTAAPEAS